METNHLMIGKNLKLILKEYGFQGFLIGENFMNQEHPGVACQEFINQIR